MKTEAKTSEENSTTLKIQEASRLPSPRPYVENFFRLNRDARRAVAEVAFPPDTYPFLSELLYYKNYSRISVDGAQEAWPDTVLRVVDGVMSIRKDWYLKNRLRWDERRWQAYASDLALSLAVLEWSPPGRGLFAMGTPFLWERGALALYNCAFAKIGRDLADALCWIMDALMHGVGVGFEALRDDGLVLHDPSGPEVAYVIPDTREGWVESLRLLLSSYQQPHGVRWRFDYSLVRPAGSPIRGFGGTSAGPEPLRRLHEKARELAGMYIRGDRIGGVFYDSVMLKTDLGNIVGVCVVAGNVRRSAEIALGSVHDKVFLDLKDYRRFPYRAEFGWMSNNSVKLRDAVDFDCLGEVARRVSENGEPGYLNLKNFAFGRVGKSMDGLREDEADGLNPCGEISLEDRELCNVVERFPTRCSGPDRRKRSVEFATFYSSTVALLPTYSEVTNAVMARNRRIGVSLVDFSGWKQKSGAHKVTRWLRDDYEIARRVNRDLAREAGVPESIRVTTVKPGGTVPLLAGRVSGIGHANFDRMVRRVLVSPNDPIYGVLDKAGVPHEPSKYDSSAHCFEIPLRRGNGARVAGDVSLWEQAMNLVMVQREWADNAVSNTLTFREHERDQIEAVLSAIAPLTKSVALLPHSERGAYEQMPEEGVSAEEYERRASSLRAPDWRGVRARDGEDQRFCDGDACEAKP